MLDSRGGVFLMSQSHANYLKLHCFLQWKALNGSGIVQRLRVQAHQFLVVSCLKPTTVPSNRQELLQIPSLSNLHLSDPELGGSIELFLGNMDLEECVYDEKLKFDGLKVINTLFG